MSDTQFQIDMRDNLKTQMELILSLKDGVGKLTTEIKVLSNDHQALKTTYQKVAERLEKLEKQSLRNEVQVDAIQKHLEKATKMSFSAVFLKHWKLWVFLLAGLSFAFYRVGEFLFHLPPPI